MNNDNPFLATKLFRSEKDQERINKEKADLQASKINISFTLYHGWFSQSDADKNNFYEEWENMNGATVAVTSVVDKQNSTKPVSDARYVGTLAKRLRRVNLEGDEIVNRNINVLLGSQHVNVSSVKSVRDAIARSGYYLKSTDTYNLRVEENGSTIFDGSYAEGIVLTFDDTSSYTIILKAIEKPVIAPTSAIFKSPFVLVTFAGKSYEVRKGVSLYDFTRIHVSRPELYIYTFDGIKVDHLSDFKIMTDGTLRTAVEPVPPAPPSPTPPTPRSASPTAYVDAKLGGIKNTSSGSFASIKDVEGNLCHTQAEIDASIRKYYKDHRSTSIFMQGTTKRDTHHLHVQASRRWPVGTTIVAAKNGTTWVPVCTLEDWTRVLDVDVPNW